MGLQAFTATTIAKKSNMRPLKGFPRRKAFSRRDFDH
jgi:hypothetical protein